MSRLPDHRPPRPLICTGCGVRQCRYVTRLRAEGHTGEEAARRLHDLLLRMAYVRLRELRATWHSEADELALEAADEALVSVLAHLDDFRGESRFTTWACRFAITEAGAALRRRRRWHRETPVDAQALTYLIGARESVAAQQERAELVRIVCEAINGSLHDRQRDVLIALAIDGRSAQALARRLDVSTGALYKRLYDARHHLRAELADQGVEVGGRGGS